MTNFDEVQKMGAASNKARSDTTAREYAPIIAGIDPDGELTNKEIAVALNNMGRQTPRGKPWTGGNNRRLLGDIKKFRYAEKQAADPLFGIYA